MKYYLNCVLLIITILTIINSYTIIRLVDNNNVMVRDINVKFKSLDKINKGLEGVVIYQHNLMRDMYEEFEPLLKFYYNS